MDSSTRDILFPFLGLRKPRKPYFTRIKEVNGSIVKLDNGLRVAMPQNGKKYGVGDTVLVVDGSIGS